MADAAKDVAKQATETTNPEKLLDKLLEFEPAAAPVISLYLDTRVDEHGKRNFLPVVRKQLGERAKSYEARTPERESFDRDRYASSRISKTASTRRRMGSPSSRVRR